MKQMHLVVCLFLVVGQVVGYATAIGFTGSNGVGGMHGQQYFGRKFETVKRQVLHSGCSSHFYNNQKLDHFTESDTRTFAQRYIICQQYALGDDAPALIYVGGEGPEGSDSAFSSTTHGEMMRSLNGVHIILEHRYYGASYPKVLPNASIENLQYLTSQQALEDMKQFIEYISNVLPQEPDMLSTPPLNLTYSMKNSIWAVGGGSYPGNLAAWMKEKHGDVISGAISYSAPILAQYDFHGLFTVLRENLKTVDVGGSDECFNFWDDALDLYATRWLDPNGKIPFSLKPCEDSPRDSNTLYYTIVPMLVTLTGGQTYLDIYDGDEIGKGVRLSCREAKKNMDIKGGTWKALEWLSNLTFHQVGANATGSCFNTTLDVVVEDDLGVVTWPETPEEEKDMAARLWRYQYCHEFGYLQSFFGVDPQNEVPAWKVFTLMENMTLENYVRLTCANRLDKSWTLNDVARGVEQTNAWYHGRQIQVANVTFVNEGLDPWSVFGITPSDTPWHNYCPDGNSTFCDQNENLSDGSEIIFIPLGSHCLSLSDLTSKSEMINPKLMAQWTAANAKILRNLRRYIYGQ